MSYNILDWVEPLLRFLPEVASPPRKIAPKDKFLWTAVALLIFLICCQIPLWGAISMSSTDPFYWVRVILASNKGTLMELGISPIVTSGMVMQLLVGAKIIEVDQSLKDDRRRYEGAQKLLSLIITVVEAVAYVMSGQYGEIANLGSLRCCALIAQLFFSGIMVMLLDELLQKGYGLGSGISLFIATNIAESVVWRTFSPIVINTGKGNEFEGALVSLVHKLIVMENKVLALKQSFYRENAPNIMQLLSTIIVFLVVIYFQGFRVELPVQSKKAKNATTGQSIRLFYTSNMPIILQTALVSNVFFISQILQSRYSANFLVGILGKWESSESYGGSVPTGGLAQYLSPPRTFKEMYADPIHCLFYLIFMLGTCSLFSKLWIEVSGSGPKDVAKQLAEQNMFLRGYRDTGFRSILNKYIPTAAALGGLCIGMLSIFSDFLGAMSSGTGIMLAVTIIQEFYEKAEKEKMM